MQSTIVKRSVSIGGHRTSVSLEDAFWKGLREIARRWHITLSELIEEINTNRKQGTNLSSAIRLFVLEVYQDQIAPPEKSKSGPLRSVGLGSSKSPIGDGRRMANIDRRR
jgi:predicted DNA-binding ribbon-helix-helix protein